MDDRATRRGHEDRADDAAGPDALAASLADPNAEGPQDEIDDPLEPSEGIVGHVGHVVGSMRGALGSVIGAAGDVWSIREAMVERRIKRTAREPLTNLYEVYPESRSASPRELGMRFVPVEDIRGTAVAGAAQRGGDFLPLKPFRGENWESRWRRIRQAYERMQPLPPVDLIKYDGDYWVVDGHNRVAAALYGNGAGLDAMVTELVPMDGHTSERPSHVLSSLVEAGELRAAAQGHRPALGLHSSEPLDLIPASGDLAVSADESSSATGSAANADSADLGAAD